MPRNDLKAYTSVVARIPQELADQVKQYARQHRCSVSELIRDGLEMRLESGEVPGRSTPHSRDHGDEVLHEVLQVLPEVLQQLSSTLVAQIQDMIRTTVIEVAPGHPSLPQPHTIGITSVIPMVPTLTPAPQPGEGHTTVIPMVPTITQPATEVLPGDTSTPQPHAPIAEQGMTEVLHDKPDFDATRFVLGKLCVGGHAYQDTGETLYRLPKHVCPPCDAAKARERRARQKATAQAQEG